VLTSVVTGLIWSNLADEFAETYNRALRKKLGIDGAGAGDTTGSTSHRPLAWVPVAVGQDGAQCVF
jgi:hypothetical protein